MIPRLVDPPPQLVVLGNPRSRRAAMIAAAARRVGITRQAFVSYRDYLANPECLSERLKPGVVLRIEAPSEDWVVAQNLLKLGAEARAQESHDAIPPTNVDNLKHQRGEIVAPRQWYLGLVQVMKDLQKMLVLHPQVRWMASPWDIPVLFDKRLSQSVWQIAGVPVPKFWSDVRSYEQLREIPTSRLFIKLAHGYSAMGAIALHVSGTRIRALTTVEIGEMRRTSRLYVSKRMHTIMNEREIALLFNRLADEGVIVEEWLPKARIHAMSFDIRVVTICGRPRHIVGRASASPFTNLNLDAHRVDALQLRERLGEHWEMLLRATSHAASVFSTSQYLGLDVLAAPTRDNFVLLEANAWGDYLPGLHHQGQDTYEAEFRSMLPFDEGRGNGGLNVSGISRENRST